MTAAEMTAALIERNLMVGTWTDKNGKAHVSLTRVGRYNKNIAVPIEMVPVVIEAMEARVRELLED